MTYEQMKFKLGDYLRCCKEYEKHVRELELLKEKLRHAGITVDISKPKVKTSAAGHAAYAEWIEDAMFREKQLEEEIRECRLAKKTLEQIIDILEDHDQQSVLRYKYLNGWNWNEIGRVMNYSRDWARHVCYDAIKTLSIKSTTHNHS